MEKHSFAVLALLATCLIAHHARAALTITNFVFNGNYVSFTVEGTLSGPLPGDGKRTLYFVNSTSGANGVLPFTENYPRFSSGPALPDLALFFAGHDQFSIYNDYFALEFSENLKVGEVFSGTYTARWDSDVFDPAQVATFNVYWGYNDNNKTPGPLQASVNVVRTYHVWKATQSFPNSADEMLDDADEDGLPNLFEYAFLGDPNNPDSSKLPVHGLSIWNKDRQSIRFIVRKGTIDLRYIVEVSETLQGAWSPIWTFDSASQTETGNPLLVIGRSNSADHTIITVEDSVPATDIQQRFMRLRVVQE